MELDRGLFIPLNREYYEDFRMGLKKTEYRKYGPRWNERTAYPGRRVTLSLGYGRAHRLFGTIVWSFKEETMPWNKAFLGIYGNVPAWCMELEIPKVFNERELARVAQPIN